MMAVFSGNVNQQLQEALAAINSGKARLESRIVGAGSESLGSEQNVLVSDDGTVFPDVIARKLGGNQVVLETSAPASYGTNAYVAITTSINPQTGAILPVQSQNQINVGRRESTGGFGFLNNTLGAVNDYIGGDPLKAAALFSAAAYGLPALGEATAAGTAGAGGGLLSGAGGAAGAAGSELTAQQTLAAIGAEQAAGMTAAETLAAIQAEQAAAGAAGGIAGAGAAGAAGAGALGAAGAGAGALTAAELGKLGLISGGLGLAGGLLQGQSSQDAARQLAAQQAALAEKTLQMGKFQPVGVTTRFGTSAFTTDPVTGAITPSYTLSPEAKAYQDTLAGMGTQSLAAGQGLMNLGQQYIGESPEAVRKRYMETQLATLAPAQEQTLAGIRNQLQQTGRGGFATGATSAAGGGLLATSPELAAYYNSLANTQRQLAAEAEKQYQGQVNFGQGLLTGAVKPFESAFGAQKAVETAGQQPLGLSMDFANLVAQRGSDQARNYAAAMAPSLQAQYSANAFNPWATAIQGASSNPLTTYGLYRLATG